MKLTESVAAHAESIRILEEHMLSLADEKEDLELGRDKFDLLKEDLQNQIIQLEFQLEQANEKLQVPLRCATICFGIGTNISSNILIILLL